MVITRTLWWDIAQDLAYGLNGAGWSSHVEHADGLWLVVVERES